MAAAADPPVAATVVRQDRFPATPAVFAHGVTAIPDIEYANLPGFRALLLDLYRPEPATQHSRRLLGIDPGRVILWGDSADAQLAALSAATCGSPRFARNGGGAAQGGCAGPGGTDRCGRSRLDRCEREQHSQGEPRGATADPWLHRPDDARDFVGAIRR